jgi:hypothetical protein
VPALETENLRVHPDREPVRHGRGLQGRGRRA